MCAAATWSPFGCSGWAVRTRTSCCCGVMTGRGGAAEASASPDDIATSPGGAGVAPRQLAGGRCLANASPNGAWMAGHDGASINPAHPLPPHRCVGVECSSVPHGETLPPDTPSPGHTPTGRWPGGLTWAHVEACELPAGIGGAQGAATDGLGIGHLPSFHRASAGPCAQASHSDTTGKVDKSCRLSPPGVADLEDGSGWVSPSTSL
jgi:hypothetical protein